MLVLYATILINISIYVTQWIIIREIIVMTPGKSVIQGTSVKSWLFRWCITSTIFICRRQLFHFIAYSCTTKICSDFSTYTWQNHLWWKMVWWSKRQNCHWLSWSTLAFLYFCQNKDFFCRLKAEQGYIQCQVNSFYQLSASRHKVQLPFRVPKLLVSSSFSFGVVLPNSHIICPW